MKEARESGTTSNTALGTEKIMYKDTWNLFNMLALGKFSFLLAEVQWQEAILISS
jgi:hypothetical protein